MHVNICPYTHLIPVVGSKAFFFSDCSRAAYKINGNEAKTMRANILLFYTPSTYGRVKRSKQIFFEVGRIAYQIKGEEV